MSEDDVMTEERFLNGREAADMIGVHWGTLSAWRKSGRGPAYTRFGNRIRYKMSDILAYGEERKVDPNKD